MARRRARARPPPRRRGGVCSRAHYGPYRTTGPRSPRHPGASGGFGRDPPDQLGPRAGYNTPAHAACGSTRPSRGRGATAGPLHILRRVLMSIRILLAEDHVIVRQGFRVLLEQAGMVVIGEASDGPEALRLAYEHTPEVAVLDIAMPHLNGLETARRLRETVPQTKIVLLTMHTEEPYVLEALQAGTVGYVLKTQAAVDIVQAIREVMQGGLYLSPRVANVVV